MKCPKCGGDIPYGAKLCGRCGARITMKKRCPHCQSLVAAEAVICPKCKKQIGAITIPAASQKKKPLTKQWWFWTVCAVLVLGIIGNIGNAINGSKGDSGKSVSVAASPTPETAEDNVFLTAPAGKGDVMNGIKTEKIGEWGYIRMEKADAKAASMEEFLTFTDTFEGKGFNWCSILFEDGTGICFPSGNRIAATYGKVDEEGCITEAIGDIVLESDLKNYSYLPRQNDDISQIEPESQPESSLQATPAPSPAAEPSDSPQHDNSQNSADDGANNFDTYDNPDQQKASTNYVLNTKTLKFHFPTCRDVKKIAPQNYNTFNGTRDEAINSGYLPCGHCNP